MIERVRVRGVISVVGALAGAIVLDGVLRIPKRIGTLKPVLDAASGEQREGGKAQEETAHSKFSFQRAICSRTRSGAVPP